jgi:hypothetical protein
MALSLPERRTMRAIHIPANGYDRKRIKEEQINKSIEPVMQIAVCRRQPFRGCALGLSRKRRAKIQDGSPGPTSNAGGDAHHPPCVVAGTAQPALSGQSRDGNDAPAAEQLRMSHQR